ncbi:MptD family putative ECF transporter S component [Oceanotoga sp. DSM 15011]|uniref:MptD family putative ECF transporter S component n=1 Tax=Oceanotoga sp. DSM 15011 TaxID=2984951 RepID=UPI0021F3DCCC|nr:MptD family putative ECF transporter S component [Oceanotoga sp. DSM 15011]UYO99443.1 MptD family putative ECF transporter S component [Oceanotoga sp. DSM 15011]
MKFKTKDYVFLGITGALYTALYFVIIMSFYAIGLGAFFHIISPGIFALIGGTIITFIVSKCSKFGTFTILSIIIMILMSLFGGGYLPWILTSLTTAILADIISFKFGYKKTLTLGISYGILSVGQAMGSIIPVWFFVDSYKETFEKRGMTPEGMNEMINAAKGIMGFYALILVFILAFIGILIGKAILKKHFENQ